MNTNEVQKIKERQLCDRVAREMNRVEGTDYYVESSHCDPPDCLMKSRSSGFEAREAEVTTASADFVLREDAGNLSRACRTLEMQLRRCGIKGYRIELDLTDEGLRHGLKIDDISDLANLLCAELRESENGSAEMNATRIWQSSPRLAEAVGGIACDRVVSQEAVHVAPCLSAWESDGACIANAIRKKSQEYSPITAKAYDLIVGCAWHIGQSEVRSYCRANPAPSPVFRTIWVTTVFDGVFRLK